MFDGDDDDIKSINKYAKANCHIDLKRFFLKVYSMVQYKHALPLTAVALPIYYDALTKMRKDTSHTEQRQCTHMYAIVN